MTKLKFLSPKSTLSIKFTKDIQHILLDQMLKNLRSIFELYKNQIYFIKRQYKKNLINSTKIVIRNLSMNKIKQNLIIIH